MINTLHLKEIARIIPGYAFRSAIIETPTGNLRVVQTKDIKTDCHLRSVEGLALINGFIPRSNAYLQEGDVLLASRGAGNHKATVYKTADDNTIASSTLYIIRVKSSVILPEYLSLFLNSKEGQNLLSLITSGAYIQNITRKSLEELKIPIPTVEQQRNLVALQDNIWWQEQIQTRKSRLKKNIIEATLKHITKRQAL